jgi:hypothetical protein
MMSYVKDFDDGPGEIGGDPHRLRAGRDYPIWPPSIARGYVEVDRVQIDFAQ